MKNLKIIQMHLRFYLLIAKKICLCQSYLTKWHTIRDNFFFLNFTVVEGVSNRPLSKERVFTYYCMENEFNKDSNLVASAITHRLNHTNLTGITNIRLVADGCGGQNKNSILVGACSKWLLEHQNIKIIELVFPVTGHSFMPADRQFGIAEKKKCGKWM